MKETAKKGWKGRLFAFFRKALPVFAAALVMLCINSRTAYAADIYASGDNWELDTDGHLTISNQEGMEEWAPIGEAYTYSNDIKSVTIGQGVTSIPARAFESADNLTSVTIPAGVTSIGDEAFRACESLTSITIPAGVTSIGYGAFYYCESLTSITIPASVTSIGDMFGGCTSLQSVTILDGVTSIGDGAFRGCANLTSITIPASVTSIGDEAFERCDGLQSVTILDGVTSIGYGAFYNCIGLTSITIPASVTNIGDSAFIFCESLQSITIPAGVTSIGDSMFGFCESLQSVTIPVGVTSIGDAAFRGCVNLTSITIPASVTSIRDEAFHGCESLTSITIPASVTKIGYAVVKNCTSLEEVTMLGTSPPEFLDSGSEAFTNTAFVTRNEKGIRVPMKALNNYITALGGWENWKEYIYGYNAPLNFDPTAEDDADTDIDVLGFTEDATVYSVDVEWGAMTFQYENTTWDATEHKTVAGAGWKVYDSVKNEALDTRTDAINRIQVMNHSNAGIWTTLAYAGAGDYADTSGSFEKKADDADTDYNETGEYLFLATADNAAEVNEAGIPTMGTVYFMPSGIKEEYKKSDGIKKWSQLGTITVGVLTEKP